MVFDLVNGKIPYDEENEEVQEECSVGEVALSSSLSQNSLPCMVLGECWP